MLILYPGPDATNLEKLVQNQVLKREDQNQGDQDVRAVGHNIIIIILDSTWSQAKDIFLRNTILNQPKQVELQQSNRAQCI